MFKSIILDVQFDIDIQSRDISVSENNGTITVCVRRSGDTTQVYSVTLEAKENTIGLIADGKMYYTPYIYCCGRREGEERSPDPTCTVMMWIKLLACAVYAQVVK